MTVCRLVQYALQVVAGNFFTNGLVSVGMSAAVLGVAAVVDRAFVRRAAAQAVLAARRDGRQGAGDGRK